jgi:hypothetical protein
MAEKALNIPFHLVEGEVEQELWLLGNEIEAKVVKYLDARKISVTGDLRKSITTEVKRTLGALQARTGTDIKYAVFVHEGTRPHWPPELPIRQWAVRKLGVTGPEVRKVTYAVRAKIARSGTKARPFMSLPFRLFRNQISRRIGGAIHRGLKNIKGGNIQIG